MGEEKRAESENGRRREGERARAITEDMRLGFGILD